MDHFSFWKDPVSRSGGFDLYVNGALLIDLLRAYEAPFAEAEGYPQNAGKYAGISPSQLFLPSERLLGVADDRDDFRARGKVTILDCDCGNPGCWPLGVRIRPSVDRVIWSEFENFHRPEWDYSRFGPFEFELEQYLQTLAGRPGGVGPQIC